MALSHNVLIRGLNAILQQAPHVRQAGSPDFRRQDVADLLYYVESWVRTVHMHHDTEEECMFPAIERETGTKGLFDHAEQQHAVFTPGMDKLLTYVRTTSPEDYRWTGGMKEIFDSFSTPLTQHLYEEIDLFLGFDYLDSQGLLKGFDIGEEDAKGKANIMDMLVRLGVLVSQSPVSSPRLLR
jgi:hemerythrin-like domain-containing protein